jgi:DNA-binding CsgD family transcriptional regulator
MMPVSMVGRAEQLGELTRAWRRLTEPRKPCGDPLPVVITGPAGVGKSLLAVAALDALQPRPGIVLRGAARVHSPAPYDWLAAVLSGRETRELPIPPDALAWLAQHPDAPGERYAPGALLRLAVRTVRSIVESATDRVAARPAPAVLLVDDLHALDPASLNLVAELAATPGLPALLLVTSRPPAAAVSPELAARTLARLTGTPGAIRQHLGPLSTAEVATILTEVYAAPLPAELVDAVRARTGGNPYWLTELLATVAGLAPEALLREPIPEHVGLAAPLPASPLPASPLPGTLVPAQSPGADPLARLGPLATVPVAPGEPVAGAGAELTAREIEVLTCLAAGMSNKQVARCLGISIRTVTVHVSNLLRKTRSASRTEAALWAVQNRLAVPVRSPVS